MAIPPSGVTLVKNAIHNPAEPRHFMRIIPVDGVAIARFDSVDVARSAHALKLKEVGYDIYDPVIYFPRDDVDMARLVRSSRTTHCPLKGDTEYFDLQAPHGRTIENAAWSYVDVVAGAREIQHFIAFDARLLEVRELAPAD